MNTEITTFIQDMSVRLMTRDNWSTGEIIDMMINMVNKLPQKDLICEEDKK